MRAGFLAILAGLGLVMAVACGNDYTEDPAPPAGSSTSSSGASSSSSSSASSSGTATLVATPGTIQCGKETCAVGRQECCVSGNNDLECTAKGACSGNSTTASCDDSADCADGDRKICCSELQGFKANVSCTSKCEGITSYQTCRTNEECRGQNCIHQSCFGFETYLCGLNSFCNKL